MNSPVPPSLSCPNCGFSAKEPTKNWGSPVPALLYSNCPFLDSEASIIRSTIAEVQKELARVSDEIGPIEMVLLDLKRQQERLSHYEEGHRAILSPVRRLPPEILSEIFLRCMSGETATLEVGQSPWTPGMVCGRWRTVATSSPELWSSVEIDLDRVSEDRVPVAMFLTETLLMRSAQHPLSLVVTSRNRPGSHTLLNVIALHSTRWQDVSLDLTFSAFQSLNQVRGRLPLLQRLTTGEIEFGLDPSPQLPMVNAFEFAPLLYDVCTKDCPNMESSLVLPWPQLKQYQGWFGDVENAVAILHQAPNLVECTLYLYEEVTPLVPIPPLQLTRLRSLAISGHVSCTPGDIFGCLTLPALEDIRIGYYHADLANSLHSLVSRSSCPLNKLTLDDVDMDDVGILQLLRNLPQLVDLRLMHFNVLDMITDRLLIDLTYRSDSTLCLAPHLCSITFRGRFSCNHNLLVDMVESRFKNLHNAKDSRTNTVERLQFVGLEGCSWLEEDARIRLQELRVQGLKVSGREGAHYGSSSK